MEIAQYLIKHGAHINAVDIIGFTPLHWAAQLYAPALITCLIKSGADLTAVAQGGEQALDCAMKRGNTQALKILLKFGAPMTYSNASKLDQSKYLLDKHLQEDINLIYSTAQCADKLYNEGKVINLPTAYDSSVFIERYMSLLKIHGFKSTLLDYINSTNLSDELKVELKKIIIDRIKEGNESISDAVSYILKNYEKLTPVPLKGILEHIRASKDNIKVDTALSELVQYYIEINNKLSILIDYFENPKSFGGEQVTEMYEQIDATNEAIILNHLDQCI